MWMFKRQCSNEDNRFEQLSLAISQDLADNVSTKDYQAIPFNTNTGLTLSNAVVENGYVRNKITGGIGTKLLEPRCREPFQ